MRSKVISVAVCICALSLLSACGGRGSSMGAPVETLSIIAANPPDGTVGSTYAGTRGFSFAAVGGSAPYTWNWSAAVGSSLPPGLTLSASSGKISGSPTTSGVYLLAIDVSDSSSPANQASFSCQIAVSDPSPLTITSPDLPDAVLSAPYGGDSGFFLSASGGVAPYTWTWAADAGSMLPSGLVLDANNGVISGAPTTLGTYNLSITVSDSESVPSQSSVAYIIAVTQSAVLTITSGALPPGTVGTSYGGVHVLYGHQFSGFPLTNVGGVSPYTWSWAAASGSSLPPGLTVSVLFYGGQTRCCLTIPVVAGTPSTAGTYDVILTVKDSATPSAQASAPYTVTISP